MPVYTDQLGRSVEIIQSPGRIISLVPSQTELLFDLGLNEEVIGITKFCIHPDHWFRNKTRVGGTKQLHIDKIRELQPDLIIANKEENLQDQIEILAEEFPVWISDVNNLDDALDMVESIAAITNRKDRGKEMAIGIMNAFSQLPPPNSTVQTCYLIWREPYMTVGGDTFISDIMRRTGFRNLFEQQKRYPEVALQELNEVCDLLFLSSEPFPFQQKHIDELQPLLPNTKIILVDGEMFSWYGSRLLKAPAYFRQLGDQVLSLNHAAGNG